MKASRLLSILLALQTRGTVSAVELSTRLEVSTRTILRDVEALSAAGVPVYTERGRHGGIALLPGYRTDVTGLTDPEAAALFLMSTAAAHESLGLGAAQATAVQKLLAALPAARRSGAEAMMRHLLIEPSGWMRPGPAEQGPGVEVERLKDAVFAQQRLRIGYRHSGTATVRRYTLDPYGLVAKGGVWYLVAERGGTPQLFRADRIQSCTMLGEPVQLPGNRTLKEVWAELKSGVEGRAGSLKVAALVHPDILGMFSRITAGFLVSVAEPAEGGWPAVELAYPEVRAVHQLLQFGPNVRITGPPEAVAELRDWARRAWLAHSEAGGA